MKAIRSTIAAGAGLATLALWADDNEREERGERGEYPNGMMESMQRAWSSRRPAQYLQDPKYPLYKDECGSCHFAYPPTMLPAASWERVMAGLGAHFGDNADSAPR
jgi:hypothetical protein